MERGDRPCRIFLVKNANCFSEIWSAGFPRSTWRDVSLRASRWDRGELPPAPRRIISLRPHTHGHLSETQRRVLNHLSITPTSLRCVSPVGISR